MIKCSALVAVLASVLLHSAAIAEQAPLRIGLVYCFSGPFAVAGAQVDVAINLFMKRHGDVVAGRKVEIVRRDTTGPAPDVARRLAGELVTREKVEILQSSGSTILDAEVLRTLRLVGPLGSFPKGYDKEKFNLIAFFQYGIARGMSRGVLH